MLIIDVSEYVDVVGIAQKMAEIGVTNAMATSSLLAEEVCLFYMRDLILMRGETFVIEPKPRWFDALHTLCRLGHLDIHQARLVSISLEGTYFNLKDLKAALQHIDYLYKPVHVQPMDARPTGLLAVRLERNGDE